MDAVFIVRPGANEELRYALRSLKNVPHDNVHIIGGAPDWVTNATVHELPRLGSKYRTTEASMRYACEHPDISETFQYWNDDMFAVKKVRNIPTHNRGTIREVINHYRNTRNNWSTYLQGMEQTLHLLESRGHPDPLSFELHIPMVIRSELMLDAINLGQHLRAPHKRSIYGALAGLTGTQVDDVKVYGIDDPIPQGPWLSSQDSAFRYGVGQVVRWLFPNPGKYEVSGA